MKHVLILTRSQDSHTPPVVEGLQHRGARVSLLHTADFPGVLNDHLFRWFLQWYMPGCQIRRKKVQLRDAATMMDIITIINPDEQRQLMVQFSGATEWQITTYGIDNLWNELMNAYDIFERLGKPQVSAYTLAVIDNAAKLTIQTLELSV